MTTIAQIKCDICGDVLKDNEIDRSQPIMGFGGKPKSKCRLIHIHDGQKAEGDLCYSCSLKIKRYREDIKAGKKK